MRQGGLNFLFSKLFQVHQPGASGPFQEVTTQLTENTTLGLGVCLGEWLWGVLDLRAGPHILKKN